MNIETFRNSPMSGELADLLKQPVLATAMQVMADASPANAQGNISEQEHIAHFQHGLDRGYNFALQLLRALATAPPAQPEIPPTYAPEGEDGKEKE